MIAWEICAGTGALALGFRRAGIEFAAVVEHDVLTAAAYEENLGARPIKLDMRELRSGDHGRKPVDLVVVDPPCAPWSRAGRRRGLDDDRDLLRPIVTLAGMWQPQAVLVCNIPGLDDATFRPLLRELTAPLVEAGYCVADHARLNAAQYGTPQRRRRPFWFWHRRDRPCLSWPAPTHHDGPGDPLGLPRAPTAREAVEHLEPYLRGEELGERGMAPAGVHRMPWPWDRPATTVTCDPRLPPPGHNAWGYARSQRPGTVRLSLPAAIALQGLPATWTLTGDVRHRWSQVGQALPPQLGEAVGRSVRAWFEPGAVAS